MHILNVDVGVPISTKNLFLLEYQGLTAFSGIYTQLSNENATCENEIAYFFKKKKSLYVCFSLMTTYENLARKQERSKGKIHKV